MKDILFVIGVSGLVSLASLLCMMVIRKMVGHQVMARHNDVAGFIYAVIGVVYATLLAFVVVVEWQMFDGAESKAGEEAQCLSSVFNDIAVLSAPQVPLVQNEIIRYTTVVINEEWPSLAKGMKAGQGNDSVYRIFRLVAEIRPANDYERIWYQEIITRLNNFRNARSMRLYSAESCLPSFMWLVLIAGGVITIGFSFLFGTDKSWAHMLMVVALACTITLVLLLINALDYPFQGLIRITPDVFVEQLAHYRSYVPLPK